MILNPYGLGILLSHSKFMESTTMFFKTQTPGYGSAIVHFKIPFSLNSFNLTQEAYIN